MRRRDLHQGLQLLGPRRELRCTRRMRNHPVLLVATRRRQEALGSVGVLLVVVGSATLLPAAQEWEHHFCALRRLDGQSR
jgi:hypothetical protein